MMSAGRMVAAALEGLSRRVEEGDDGGDEDGKYDEE